jgi:branched-chain amino acid transport system ATP-binding protein
LTPLVEVRGLRAAYERIEVVRGVSFAVDEGEVVALLGPNGAGKSTTLKVIAGLMPASGGDILLDGRRVNGARPDDLARAGVCLIPEGRGVFPNLTVRENLRVATHVGRRQADVESAAFERFPRLAERRDQLVGTMSGGEQQMLALARGLASDPAVLLLDELSMGLAPLVVESLYERVAEIAREGVSIILVEQFARVVLDVAARAAIMVHGVIRSWGTPQELASELQLAYLGGGSH